MIPFSCAASSASAICLAIVSASSIGSAPFADALGQRLAGNQFHDQVMHAAGLFEAVDRGDVGMIQRRQHVRFALKAGQAFGIMRKRCGKNFDGHVAPELGVVRLDTLRPCRPRRAGRSPGTSPSDALSATGRVAEHLRRGL